MKTDRLKAKALTVGDNPKWVEGYYNACGFKLSTSVAHFISHIFSAYDEINPDTLCQCTGLKDSNGDLIYQGDILDHAGFGLWRVHWNLSEWVLRLHNDRLRTVTPIQDVEDMTLTGENIHDINQ